MAKPSSRNLDALPNAEGLLRLCRSLAVLDAILSPEWDYRYYSFDSKWDAGEQMASMRNGSGDHWFAHFTEAGVILFGLAHESELFRCDDPMPGILNDVPAAFSASVAEPAFETQNISFCLWLLKEEGAWRRGPVEFPEGPDPDGSEDLLGILDGGPASYKAWAEEYFGVEVNLLHVEAVYGHTPLTGGLVKILNPEFEIFQLREDLEQIGYSHQF